MAHTSHRNSVAFDAGAAAPDGPAIASGGPWHYASIQYGKHLIGLMIETDNEDAARREAEEMCESFAGRAILLGVMRVVLQ